MLYLSPHFNQKGLFLSGSPNIYVLSIYSLRMNSDPRFVEIGHVHTPTYNGDPNARRLWKRVYGTHHYKSEREHAQSRRKGLLAFYNFCVGSRGSIQIENLLTQNWAKTQKNRLGSQEKLTSKNNAAIHLCSNFPY